MIAEAKSGQMPPLQYRALHWDAKLTGTDIAALSTMGKTGKLRAGLIAPGDPARGKIVFESAARDVMQWREIEKGRGWPVCMAGEQAV